MSPQVLALVLPLLVSPLPSTSVMRRARMCCYSSTTSSASLRPAPRCPLFSAVFPLPSVTHLRSRQTRVACESTPFIYPWTSLISLLGKSVSPRLRRVLLPPCKPCMSQPTTDGSCSCYHLRSLGCYHCTVAFDR